MLISDIMFLANPPNAITSLSEILSTTLALIWSLVRGFENSFAYIKGFDSYTVQVRRQALPSVVQADFASISGSVKGSSTKYGLKHPLLLTHRVIRAQCFSMTRALR